MSSSEAYPAPGLLGLTTGLRVCSCRAALPAAEQRWSAAFHPHWHKDPPCCGHRSRHRGRGTVLAPCWVNHARPRGPSVHRPFTASRQSGRLGRAAVRAGIEPAFWVDLAERELNPHSSELTLLSPSRVTLQGLPLADPQAYRVIGPTLLREPLPDIPKAWSVSSCEDPSPGTTQLPDQKATNGLASPITRPARSQGSS